MIYRVLRPLSTGQMPGDFVEEKNFKGGKRTIDKLRAVNAIAPVSSPPLAEVPGWTKRAEKLAEISIITIQDFLEADEQRMAKLFKYKTTSAIKRWRSEVQEWLKPPAQDKK